jgi:hypothetical protein
MNKDIFGQVSTHINNPQDMEHFCNLNNTHRSYCSNKYFWVDIFNRYNLPMTDKNYQSADDYIREFYAQFYAAKIVNQHNYSITKLNIIDLSYYLQLMVNIGMQIPEYIQRLKNSLLDVTIDKIGILYKHSKTFFKDTFELKLHTTENVNLYFLLITPKELQQFIYILLIDDAVFLDL